MTELAHTVNDSYEKIEAMCGDFSRFFTFSEIETDLSINFDLKSDTIFNWILFRNLIRGELHERFKQEEFLSQN
jgi:hypothetical protein